MTACAEIVRWMVRDVTCMIIFYLGIIWVFRLVRWMQRKPLLLILSYHGARQRAAYLDMFFPPELFAEQMRYLSGRYACVTIDEVMMPAFTRVFTSTRKMLVERARVSRRFSRVIMSWKATSTLSGSMPKDS